MSVSLTLFSCPVKAAFSEFDEGFCGKLQHKTKGEKNTKYFAMNAVFIDLSCH